MSDVVIFAGPIMLNPTFSKIDWMGRDVRIVTIPGAGSENFKRLGMSWRDYSTGRILPEIKKKYFKGIENVESISVCAYSAGHGLVNQLGLNSDDLAEVSAVILSDACFIGNTRPAPEGLTNWAAKGALGKGLFVATSSRGKGETYRNGTDSVSMIWTQAALQTNSIPSPVAPQFPIVDGTWQRLGESAYWGDIPTLTHGQHHDYAPVVWQAYLAPYLSALAKRNAPLSGLRRFR